MPYQVYFCCPVTVLLVTSFVYSKQVIVVTKQLGKIVGLLHRIKMVKKKGIFIRTIEISLLTARLTIRNGNCTPARVKKEKKRKEK